MRNSDAQKFLDALNYTQRNDLFKENDFFFVPKTRKQILS